MRTVYSLVMQQLRLNIVYKAKIDISAVNIVKYRCKSTETPKTMTIERCTR